VYLLGSQLYVLTLFFVSRSDQFYEDHDIGISKSLVGAILKRVSETSEDEELRPTRLNSYLDANNVSINLDLSERSERRDKLIKNFTQSIIV
jgi:hypothetical protein